MKCLFVRAPFAGWIVDRVKHIEYRTRPTNIRGRIGIIQSGTGTVIGDVKLTLSRFNSVLGRYEWLLWDARRYKRPVSFVRKRGAIVWIDIDMDPEEQEFAPTLGIEELIREGNLCSEELKKYLKDKTSGSINSSLREVEK